MGLGQQVKGIDDETARKNFRVIILKADEVEQCDLSVPDKARRWKYTFVGPEGGSSDQPGKEVGEWKVEELWP